MPIRSSPVTAQGICGKTCPYLVLVCGLDGVQGLPAVASRVAQDNKVIFDELNQAL